jgi:hypothetical protein
VHRPAFGLSLAWLGPAAEAAHDGLANATFLARSSWCASGQHQGGAGQRFEDGDSTGQHGNDGAARGGGVNRR